MVSELFYKYFSIMKFFDREKEIGILKEVQAESFESAQLTVLTGRRRVGKTSLVLKAYEGLPLLYFFVGRKTEKDLCEEYSREIEYKLGVPVLGNASQFYEVFEYVLKIASSRQIILFIDEFQEFQKVNSSIFSDIQKLWDLYKNKSAINLIVSGSVYSLMHKIFFDIGEPLYGRASHVIKLRAFPPSVMRGIMQFYNPTYSPDDLLALYSFTGGVAKYVELLIDSKAFTKEKMIERMISDGSSFLEEGKIVLLNEFGKDYGRYFSILSAIASGHTQRSRIENIIGEEISGYVSRLETDYEIIEKRQPILEKTKTKNVRYGIRDNFLTFWFRFVFKYNYLIEIGNYSRLRQIIFEGYDVFSGFMLERYFSEVMKEKEKFTRVGQWWDRKNEYEIDIVAIDEFERLIEFYEVKRNPAKISLPLLEDKIRHFMQVNPEVDKYARKVGGLSLIDMPSTP